MNAKIVMDALRQIHDEDGRTIICNLHTLDTARSYCDRVIGMRGGRIVVKFTGGHEQTIVVVANGDIDAGVTWADGLGNWEDGYNSGALRSRRCRPRGHETTLPKSGSRSRSRRVRWCCVRRCPRR